MDLRSTSRRRHTEPAAAATHQLPNTLRFSAIAQSLPYITNSELNALHLQLIELCQPPEPHSHPLLRAIRRRRTEQDATAARLAAKTLLARWDTLAPVTRRLALAADGVDWAPLAASLLDDATNSGDRGTPARPGTIDAVTAFYGDASDLRAEPATLSRLLCSGSPRAVALAEAHILEIILGGVATPPAEMPSALREHRARQAEHGDPVAAAQLATDAAVCALDAYHRHGRAQIASAALLLLDRPTSDATSRAVQPMRTLLANPDHPAFAVLRRALKRDRSPAVRRIAWRALKPGPLAMASLERLESSAGTDPREHNAALPLAHLILNPARARVLAGPGGNPTRTQNSRQRTAVRSNALTRLLPTNDAPLTTPATRGLAALLARADEPTTKAILARLLATPDDHARLTAARHATDSQSLADLCLDRSPAVSTTAALRRSPVGVAGPSALPEAEHRRKFTALLARSPHATVRGIARRDLADCALLNDAGRPSVRALAMAHRDPDALSKELKSLLVQSGPRTRVNAIRAACRLGVTDGWHAELASIIDGSAASESASVVAATAAAALGSIPTRATLRTVNAALDHPDPRVRANAVESLERLIAALGPGMTAEPGSAHPANRLSEIKRSPDHRARANALRAIARLRLGTDAGDPIDDPASDELVRMLTDDRGSHRLAAVWLAERVLCDPRRPAGRPTPAWQAAARCVAALARDDTESHTRARAARCARRLLAEVSRPATHADPALGTTARRLREMRDRPQALQPAGVRA